jgi:hypothetical protein
LLFEVVILNPEDLAEMGLMNATVGGGLSPSQHFGIDHAGEETQVAEFPVRPSRSIADPVGRMTELEPAQVGQQLSALLRSQDWTCLPSALVFRGARFFGQQPLEMLDRSLAVARGFQIFGHGFRRGLGSHAGGAMPRRGLAAHETRYRGVAEGAVTGGMPQASNTRGTPHWWASLRISEMW